MTPDTSQKLEIDWLKTAGGAFAAVSSAFLLSTLGAAGTIIGAALGSVIVTVGGALYSQGLARSHQRLAQVQTVAMRKVGVAQAEVRRAARNPGDGEAIDAHLAHAEERLDDVKDDFDALGDEPTGPSWRERLVMLPWKRISLATAGVFVVAVLAITAFELVAGKSVSSITGGTEGGGGPTIGRLVGGSGGDTSERDPSDDPAPPSDAPSNEPSDEPAPTPADEPTAEPTPPAESPAPAITPTTPTPSAPPAPEAPAPSAPPTTAPTG